MKKAIGLGIVAVSLTSCGMTQYRSNFTDYLTAAHMSGNGLYVEISDEAGQRAKAEKEIGEVSVARTDSADMHKSPYYTVVAKRIDETNRVEAANMKAADAQRKLQGLMQQLQGGK